ncbi:MAG: hypothetical protein ABI867_25105 [Kofleriaceae bacterium]
MAKKPAARSKSKSRSKAKTKARKVAKAKASKPKAKPRAKAKAKKTKPKAKPTKAKPAKTATFATLAPWQPVAIADAGFDIGEATNDSVYWEDAFGDVPEHLMVHAGDIAIAGPVELDGHRASEGAQQTAYIIDGNLELAGPLVFSQSDICTTLWVTGNVTASRIACAGSAMLIVGGTLTVAEVLLTNLDDAGHLIVHGGFAAGAWIDLARGRGCIELAQQPATRFISEYYSDKTPQPPTTDDEGVIASVRPWNLTAESSRIATRHALHGDDGADSSKLVEAIRSGDPILA